MKFRYRLLAGFSLLIALSIIMITVDVFFISNIQTKISEISTRRFRINTLIQDSSHIIYQIHADAWYALIDKKDNRNPHIATLHGQAEFFYANMRTLINLSSNEDRAEYASLNESFKQYYIFANSILTTYEITDIAGMTDMFSMFRENRDSLEKKLSGIIEKTTQEYNSTIAELNSTFINTILSIVLFGILAVIISIFFAITLSKRLTDPIEYLILQSDKISRGDYTLDKSDDILKGELSHLFDAYRLMANNINTTMNTLKEETITRKNAEKQLLLQKNYLSGIIDSLSISLIAVDSNACITLYNNNANLIFTENQLNPSGRTIWNIIPFLNDYRAVIMSVIADKKIIQLNKVQHKTNKTSFYNVSIFPLTESLEDGAVFLIENITEILKKDEQIRQMQKMETINILSGGFAHDFNNILSVILSTDSLLKHYIENGTKDQDKLLDLVNTGISAGKKAAELVKNLLSLTRKQELNFTVCDLNSVIKETVAMCRRTFDKSVEFDLKYYDGTPACIGDNSQLTQIFLNLFINAWHAMTLMREDSIQGGTLSVTVEKIFGDPLFYSTHPDAVEKAYWSVSIKDTGIGMDQDTIARIFDPYFTTKKTDKGTGLGLSIVYNIIQLHQGFINVYSEPGVGTEFRVYFPAAETIKQREQREIHHLGVTGSALIIDDEDYIRKTNGTILSVFGYTVYSAADGVEALEIAQKHSHEINLIILDMSMPGISVIETFRNLKAINNSFRILLHSGFKDEKKVNQLINEGAAGFLHKPYTMDELSVKLKEILN